MHFLLRSISSIVYLPLLVVLNLCGKFFFYHTPTYTLFKSFGCACFPLLRPYSKHKLLHRSSECVFLGYASNSKGYLCLDPNTSRLYVSRHVIFDETTFPFRHIKTPSSPNATKTSSPNLWLSHLLFFTPYTHSLPSVLGPIPSSYTPSFCSPSQPVSKPPPSLLGPYPSTINSGPTSPISPISQVGQSSSDFSTSPSPNCPTPNPSSSSLLDPMLSSSILPSSSTNPPFPSSIPCPVLNSHPMQTRAKFGIFKKKAFPSLTTSSRTPDYLQTEPPTIASRNPEWRTAMDSEFAALQR